MFGVADTITGYNADKAMINSLEKENVNYIRTFKERPSECGSDICNKKITFDNQDYEEIDKLYSQNYYKVFNQNHSYGSRDFVLGQHVSVEKQLKYIGEQGTYYRTFTSGSTEISNEMAKDLNLNLLAGRLPGKNDSDNEIVISKYIYSVFEKFNLVNGEAEYEINSFDDILNKNIGKYIVVGVIDTNLNENRYKRLDKIEDFNNSNLRSEFNVVVEKGIHTLLFFREGYYEEAIRNKDEVYFRNAKINYGNQMQTLPLSFNYSITFQRANQFLNDVYYVNNETRENLANDEMILSFEQFEREDDFNKDEPNKDKLTRNIFTETNNSIENFAKLYYFEVKNDFEEMYGISTEEDYKEYIMNLGDEDNLFHPEKNYRYFEKNAKQKVLDRDFFSLLSEKTNLELGGIGGFDDEFPAKVVGVYFPLKLDEDTEQEQNYPAIVSDDLQLKFSKDIGSIIFVLNKSKSQNLDLIENLVLPMDETKVGVNKYVIDNEYSVMLSYAGGYISFTAVILALVSLLFAIFAAILLFNFISTSIREKRKDIGIWRSLGVSSKDIFKMFYIEGLLIAVICFVIALMLTFITVMIFDKQMQMEFDVPVSFIKVGFRQIFLLLFISLLISFLATFLPIWKISRKKPIDIIKDQ